MKQKNNNLSKTYKEIGPYLGLGTQLAATIVLMFFLGKWLDSMLETYPILSIIFAFMGGAVGIYNFIKETLRLNKKKTDEKNQ